MANYKLVNDPDTGELTYIKKIFDDESQNIFIPLDENNGDYQEYLKWKDGYELQLNSETYNYDWVKTSDGNTPLAADPAPE